jgi:nucleoside-diphosphate-sugar epimerase
MGSRGSNASRVSHPVWVVVPAALAQLLITGATGFVGSHVLEALLAAGQPTRVLVRSTSRRERLRELGVPTYVASLVPGADLAAAVDGADIVLHLAAATRARSAAAYDAANVAGTRALVEALLKASSRPKRLVYLSSLAALGPSADRPLGCDDLPHPLTAYGRSKLAGEKICLEAAGELEVVVIRAPAVYGPRDRDLLAFFRLARLGLVPVPAGGERPLQLIHVADLTAALQLATTSPGARGIYHVAERRSYTWREVIQLMGRAVDRDVRTFTVPEWSVRLAATASEWANGLGGRSVIFNRDKARELLAPGWLCETERATQDLGFEARIPLAEGLATTAAWYRANGWL